MAPDRVKHHLRTPPRRRVLYNKNDLVIKNGFAHGNHFKSNYPFQLSAEVRICSLLTGLIFIGA